ncbi:unnamed protein product, partial [Phaeothamnion confervicola]
LRGTEACINAGERRASSTHASTCTRTLRKTNMTQTSATSSTCGRMPTRRRLRCRRTRA